MKKLIVALMLLTGAANGAKHEDKTPKHISKVKLVYCGSMDSEESFPCVQATLARGDIAVLLGTCDDGKKVRVAVWFENDTLMMTPKDEACK